MKKISMIRVGSGAILTAILLLGLSCGGLHQAPYGSTLTMPASTSISSAGDVIFHVEAVVLDPDSKPLNAVDVDFYVCCGGGDFVDNNGNILAGPLTVRTDNIGVAGVDVIVYGDFTGEVSVNADIGTVGATFKVAKSIPTA